MDRIIVIRINAATRYLLLLCVISPPPQLLMTIDSSLVDSLFTFEPSKMHLYAAYYYLYRT